MKKLEEYFNKIEKEKISHAYIISNTTFDNIKEELEYIISEYIFNNKIEIDNNVDIMILNAYEEIVKKDEIVDLIKNISTTSQFSNKKVYIIDGCEYLSGTCYNAILKTLEEPADNVYAFLISNNIEKVNETIVSRCQRIIINSNDEVEYDEKTIDISNKILEIINRKNSNISLYNNLYNEISDMDELSKIIKFLLDYYFNKIKSINDNINEDIIKDSSKKIITLNNILSFTKSNLNKNLTIDRLIIEMWRC